MRAAVFIDGAYLQKQIQLAKVEVDYPNLADYLLAPVRKNVAIDLLRCYFYHCPPWMSSNPTEDEKRRMSVHQEFCQKLEEINRWQMRLGKLERRRDGEREYFEQKRLDVLLSCDLVRHAAAGHIQHAILVAGDSDFIPAVSAVKESGVTVTLWCGAENTVHRDLKMLADEVQVFKWRSFPKLDSKSNDATSSKKSKTMNTNKSSKVSKKTNKKNHKKNSSRSSSNSAAAESNSSSSSSPNSSSRKRVIKKKFKPKKVQS